MSHLQPKFIAQAKAGLKQARAARSMPRSVIAEQASRPATAAKRNRTDWYIWWDPRPDYRIFTLKK